MVKLVKKFVIIIKNKVFQILHLACPQKPNPMTCQTKFASAECQTLNFYESTSSGGELHRVVSMGKSYPATGIENSKLKLKISFEL
jgi:hypothetical protein